MNDESTFFGLARRMLTRKEAVITEPATRSPDYRKAAQAGKAQSLPSSTLELVEEIHSAFDTASDKQLAEAEALELPEIPDEVLRLQALGFNNAKAVQDAEAVLAKAVKVRRAKDYAEALKKTVEHLRRKYPHYRFITDEERDRICEKYGLKFSGVKNYTGVVPAKNLREIERFVECFDVTDTGFAYTVMGSRRVKPLQIAAPPTDFVEGLIEAGNELHVPDPIVLQPVAGVGILVEGSLIVTAWGPEAMDTAIQNSAKN